MGGAQGGAERPQSLSIAYVGLLGTRITPVAIVAQRISNVLISRFYFVALVAILISFFSPLPSKAQLNEVQALNKRVNELYQARKYGEAIPLAEKVLAILEKSLGANNANVATQLINLGDLYRLQNRFSDAEKAYERGLAIRQNILGSNHPDVAEALSSLASLYRTQARFAIADQLYRRALVIRQKALGPNHSAVAESLNDLAWLSEIQGGYAEAEPLYKLALAIREKNFGPNHPVVAQSLSSLAGVYHHEGRLAEAEQLLKRALAINEKSFGSTNVNVAQSLNNLAALHETQGRYFEAEPLYKRALIILQATVGPDHPYVATTVNNLATLYRIQGRYEEAEPLYQRSLIIREKVLGLENPELADSLNGLATLYHSQGRYAEAEPLYERALAIREKRLPNNHPDVAQSLNNLALLYLNEGRHREAELLNRQSLVIWERAVGPDHPNFATALNNLAGVFENEGRYSDAEEYYKRALAILEKGLGPKHPKVAVALSNLARVQDKLGRYQDALLLVRRTVSLKMANKNAAFPVLYHAAEKNLISKVEALGLSYETAQRNQQSATGVAISRLAARFAAGTDELAALVRQDQDISLESNRLDKALVAAISKRSSQRSEPAEDLIRKQIEDRNRERQRLQRTLAEKFPNYSALSIPSPLTLDETQALLSEDEALIVFDFDSGSYAWIVTRTSADWFELKITTKELEADVKTLRVALTSPLVTLSDLKPFNTQLAYKIYQATFGVFQEQLATKARLSIVTNGAMTGLPPHLLVTKDPTAKDLKEVDWFVRSHAITILPSVSSLNVLRKFSAASSVAKPMIAFADPLFSKTKRSQEQMKLGALVNRSITRSYRGTQLDIADLAERLDQLPGTRTEVEAIASVLRAERSDIFLGMAATETAVKRAKLDRYRIIYFATHGLVSGEIEEFARTQAEPALAFTIPDKPNEFDDGLLQASEVAQLKLDADWVVLSACNTAAGDKPGAEALSGLARAFFYAGARSLIVSHWEVDDQATIRLMTTIFQTSSNQPGLSHAETLRKSILSMLDNPEAVHFLHPRFWAPFVVVGEPVKLKD